MEEKNTIRLLLTISISVLLTWGPSFANEAGPGLTPDQALTKLMQGNKRYAANKLANATVGDPAVRAALTNSQKPFAVILACSDSRVAPEIIFDQGLGELFVVRVAGNIPDPVVLGSIEYAAEHLGTPLVMVLGHERCGAVAAAVEAQGKSTGSVNIDAIVKKIEPSINSTAARIGTTKSENKSIEAKKADFLENVIDTNTLAVTANLGKQSKILKHLAAENKIKIVAAKYDLDDGVVRLFK